MKNYIVVIELTKEAQEKHDYAGAYGTGWKREYIKRNIAEPFNQKNLFGS